MVDKSSPLARIAHNAQLVHIPKKQIIFRQGETYNHIYILKTGTVIMVSPKGTSQSILHVVRPLALMPFAFFSGPKAISQWSYLSYTDCELYILKPEKVRNLLQSDGQLALDLTAWFSFQVHELLIRLSSLSKSDIKEKMTAALKFLMVYHTGKRSKDGWAAVSFPITHQFIADMTGVTREGVSINMPYFQKQGVIRAPRPSALEINLKILDI